MQRRKCKNTNKHPRVNAKKPKRIMLHLQWGEGARVLLFASPSEDVKEERFKFILEIIFHLKS